ncbi:MAG: hypothetical protein C0412_15010 [Flavobacterium sp.]|nr:hypothetical protein [Flavobacterium sp.]
MKYILYLVLGILCYVGGIFSLFSTSPDKIFIAFSLFSISILNIAIALYEYMDGTVSKDPPVGEFKVISYKELDGRIFFIINTGKKEKAYVLEKNGIELEIEHEDSIGRVEIQEISSVIKAKNNTKRETHYKAIFKP